MSGRYFAEKQYASSANSLRISYQSQRNVLLTLYP